MPDGKPSGHDLIVECDRVCVMALAIGVGCAIAAFMVMWG